MLIYTGTFKSPIRLFPMRTCLEHVYINTFVCVGACICVPTVRSIISLRFLFESMVWLISTLLFSDFTTICKRYFLCVLMSQHELCCLYWKNMCSIVLRRTTPCTALTVTLRRSVTRVYIEWNTLYNVTITCVCQTHAKKIYEYRR